MHFPGLHYHGCSDQHTGLKTGLNWTRTLVDVHVVLAAEQKTEAASALCIFEEAVCVHYSQRDNVTMTVVQIPQSAVFLSMNWKRGAGLTGVKKEHWSLLFAGSLLSAESQQRKSKHFTHLQNRLQDYSCKAEPKSKDFRTQTKKRASNVVRVAGKEGPVGVDGSPSILDVRSRHRDSWLSHRGCAVKFTELL